MYNEAIECYTRAIMIDPNRANAWYKKGNAFGNLGMYNEAIECYNRFIETDPNYANAWYNKGNALHKLGMYNEAIECYNRFIETDPNYADAWYSQGNALCEYQYGKTKKTQISVLSRQESSASNSKAPYGSFI
jgi:tetratricopeptide (TPR) repeat protein